MINNETLFEKAVFAFQLNEEVAEVISFELILSPTLLLVQQGINKNYFPTKKRVICMISLPCT